MNNSFKTYYFVEITKFKRSGIKKNITISNVLEKHFYGCNISLFYGLNISHY